MLGVVANSASRIWVVDAHSRVRGLSGSLKAAAPVASRYTTTNSPEAPTFSARVYTTLVRPLVRLISAESSGISNEDPKVAHRAVMLQVDRALVGEANLRWRNATSSAAEILSVAQPIWQGDNIVGAVVLEETTDAGKSIRSAALESLLASTMIVFAVGFVTLLAFAWRLAFRVRRLQTEADQAIDSNGRIRGDIAGSDAQDEIGALSRTLNGTLLRLRRYNDYLEKMAGRLSHELRTPVAVVRSSLDNLRLGNIGGTDRVYIDRADEGVKRLASLISRMSEATQLEGMLASAEKISFDLVKVVGGCVEGYRLAYPARSFQLAQDASRPILIDGIADSIAQLLDKLVQNAVDFTVADSAIRIALSARNGKAGLMVENDGPVLSASVASQLFVSMVTLRPESGTRSGHLGLGLYMVRLIAEFHGGSVNAENTPDGCGVRFTVLLPLAVKP